MKTFVLKCGAETLTMPKLCFGADKFSDPGNYGDYARMLNLYAESGGTCIDTARYYCSWVTGGEGVSEQTAGRWIRERGLRNRVILSTKGGMPSPENMEKGRLDRESLAGDLDASLKALRTSYADLYFLHRDDESRDVSEIMPTLHGFVKSGKVRFLGASNWKAKRIEEANRFAVENGLTPFCISQINFSLAVTTPERIGDRTIVCMNAEEYGWYLRNRFPVMCFSSQAKGFFAKYLSGEPLSAKINSRYITEQNIRRARRVRELCEKYGASPAAVALAYLTCNPATLSAVMSFSRLPQLQDSLSETRLVLLPEEVAYLEKD